MTPSTRSAPSRGRLATALLIALTALSLSLVAVAPASASSTRAQGGFAAVGQVASTAPSARMTARLWRAQAACGQLMRRCASGSRAEKEWFAAREAILCPGWFGWKGRSYALPTVGRSSARSWATLLVQQAIWTHGPGRVALDGRFGPRTRAALKGWQASVGQRADGVISGSDWLRVRWGACGD